MDNYFAKVKSYLLELECHIELESANEGIFIIEKEQDGIKNMVVAVDDPLVVIEQYLFDLPADNAEVFKSLLQKNREIVHGAFVLDTTGKKVLFRDTLQIENLDLNELDATLMSLSLLMSEYSGQIIKFSGKAK